MWDKVREIDTDNGVTRIWEDENNALRTAEFSYDLVHRWKLTIEWQRKVPRINFLMLNPSTADEMKNDPTVERCMRRAMAWGFGGLVVTNIFALRSTDPKGLYTHSDPVGQWNNIHIECGANMCAGTICAWGQHGSWKNRDADVKKLLAKHTLYYLKLSKDGIPCHPLYLPYSLDMEVWDA